MFNEREIRSQKFDPAGKKPNRTRDWRFQAHRPRNNHLKSQKENAMKQGKEMNLNIMFTNADTLTKNKMLELVQTIYNRSTLPHVIAISEAKPKYSKTDFNPVTVQIPSYNMEPLNMKLTDKGRGVLLFLRDDLD